MTRKNGLGFDGENRRFARASSSSGAKMLTVARTHNVEVSLKEGSPDEDMPPGWGINLFINIMSGRRYCGFSLTDQTAEELKALRKALNIALDTAIEIAARRDEIAEEEMANGDASLLRLHRGVPILLIPKGVQSKHHPCVCDGRTTLLLGDAARGNPTGGTTGGDRDVAVGEQAELGTAHDDAQGDQHAEIPGLPEGAGPVEGLPGPTGPGAGPTPTA